MKVGILTFHFALNYGAVFQAYALKKALLNMGYDSHVINYRPGNMRTAWDFKAYCNLRKNGAPNRVKSNFIKEIFLYLLRKVDYIKFRIFEYNDLKLKYSLFNEFVDRYLCDSVIIEDKSELHELKEYYAIICGSDQIWNPNITNGFDSVYFGGDMGKGIKKISYAASVGDVGIITKNNKIENLFLSLVKNLDYVSVRERNLYEYLSSNNIKAEWVSDPTLLLSSDDYNEIIETRKVEGDYIFVYCLTYDEKLFNLAQKIANDNHWRIISVSGTKQTKNNSLHNVTPGDFLALLKYAKMVVTNSFHGVALSIVFHKDFYTVLPPKRKDRIQSLLNQSDLLDRVVNNVGENVNCDSVDFTKADDNISAQRRESQNFLRDVLS